MKSKPTPNPKEDRKESPRSKSATDLNASCARDSKGTRKTRSARRTVTHPHAAGIDIGSQSHYVAVPPGRDEKPVRVFSAYTGGLKEMVQWLKKCRVTTVAMESTGVYWHGVYQMLEQNGIEVLLVDAHSVKHVPGRKTDVCDCQWLQELHTYGLLRGAFRPADEICRLRTLQRHRKNMVESMAMHTQHIQKALNEMNLHLHHVLSDITGESGQRILDAMLAGERDARQLASLVDRRVKKSAAEIEAALTGDYRHEQLFVIGQSLEMWRAQERAIQACDAQILQQLEKISGLEKAPESPLGEIPAIARETPSEAKTIPIATGKKGRARQSPKTAQEHSFRVQLQRILGVDLTQIPGLGVLAVLTLLSEIGTDMNKWRNAKAFASWLGLAPCNKVSGGRVLSSRTRPVVSRAATILRMAAMALGRTQTPLGSFYRRKQAQLGAPKAITATARKLACLIYELLKTGQPYQAADVRVYDLNYKKRAIAALRRRAADLGCDLVESPVAA